MGSQNFNFALYITPKWGILTPHFVFFGQIFQQEKIEQTKI